MDQQPRKRKNLCKIAWVNYLFGVGRYEFPNSKYKQLDLLLKIFPYAHLSVFQVHYRKVGTDLVNLSPRL